MTINSLRTAALILCIFTSFFSFAQNNALQFDGVDDEVMLGNWFNFKKFTISMWVNPGSTQKNYANIIDNNHLGDNESWVVQQNYTTTNYYYFANHYGLCYFSLNAGQWQLLTITQDTNGVKKLYINGILIDSVNTTNNPYNTPILRLGNAGVTNRNWNGKMDELQIWDKPLSANEISILKTKKLSGAEKGLIAYYDFNESSGDTLHDKTTNKHHGILVKKPKWVSSEVNVGQTIIPNVAGNTNISMVKIYGSDFQNGARVKFTRNGFPDIVSDTTYLTSNKKVLISVFNLTGKDTGLYDVVVVNIDSSQINYPDGFTIVKGTAPDVWVDIIGRNAVRNGRPFTFLVNYGNKGNVDAKGVVLWVAVPQFAKVNLGLDMLSPDSNLVFNDTFSYYVNVDSLNGEPNAMKVIPLFLPRIPPNYSNTFKITLDSFGSKDIYIDAWINDPWYQSPLKYLVGECADQAIGAVTSFFPGVGCAYEAFDAIGNVLIDPLVTAYDPNNKLSKYNKDRLENKVEAFSFPLVVVNSLVRVGLNCIPGFKAAQTANKVLLYIIKNSKRTKTESALRVGVTCLKGFLPKSETERNVVMVNSYDPNEKIGPNKYMKSNSPFSYLILFENKDSAKAPAQEVVVIDTLDKSKFDLNSFSFGSFGFGDTFTSSTFQYQKQFSKDIDLRPKTNLIVKIEGRLDTSSGVLYWKFQSLDPKTLDLTEDPLGGFLPPNKKSPEGEGWISFTVNPISTLPTGTNIQNKASIIFDLNKPIITNNYKNVIDDIKPMSNIKALSLSQRDSNFMVSWQGSDVGSGIRSYDVFVSEDTGLFKYWLHNSSNTSEIFNGSNKHKYRFYSIATDSAGNIENDTMPIVSTIVSANSKIVRFDYSGISLSQNYPNPFSSTTTFDFYMPQTMNATISIMDVFGRTVQILDNIQTRQGVNSIVFDKKNLASGIYIYQLNIGEITLSKMMIIN